MLSAALAVVSETRGLDRAYYASVTLRPGQRELFLDDYILGDVYRVARVIHPVTKYKGNPVIKADRVTDGKSIQVRTGPSWDEKEKVWKVWYFRLGDDHGGGAGYATSKDGIAWEKPKVGVIEINGNRDNNVVTIKGDPKTFLQHVFIDPTASPDRRYKGVTGPDDRDPVVSADGFVFTRLNVPTVPSQDESHLMWDELQKQYLMTVKHNGPFGRSVFLCVSKDFEKWTEPTLIYYADSTDQMLGEQHIREIEDNPRMWRPTINTPSEYNTEIYNMPIFVYEGLYIGMPTYFESSGRVPLPIGNQDGINSVKLTCSRDLKEWTRIGDRRHFIPVSEMGGPGIDTGQILAASPPIRKGDELWFYYSGLDVRYRPFTTEKRGDYHGGIHLAKLRLDGFVSLQADDEGGFIDTRPVQIEGRGLFVNANIKGSLRAEITDRSGRDVLPGWEADKCNVVTGDQMRAELRWKGRDFKELAGQSYRIRFYLSNADFYSFWIEP